MDLKITSSETDILQQADQPENEEEDEVEEEDPSDSDSETAVWLLTD